MPNPLRSKEATTDAKNPSRRASTIHLVAVPWDRNINDAGDPASGHLLRRTTGSLNSEADLAWWDLFRDPVLQGSIREALKNSYDLGRPFPCRAGTRPRRRHPLAVFSSSGIWGKHLGAAVPYHSTNHTYYGYSFSTIWEIDLFGRIRKLNEAQRAVYFATEDARRDIRLLVMSEVAQGYFQFRALDAQLEIAQGTVKGFRTRSTFFNIGLKVVMFRVWRLPGHGQHS